MMISANYVNGLELRIRELTAERNELIQRNAELVAQVEVLRKEFQDARRTLQAIASCGADSTDKEIVDVVLSESRRWVSRYDDSALKATPAQCLRQIQAEAVNSAVAYICDRAIKDVLRKSEIRRFASEYTANHT